MSVVIVCISLNIVIKVISYSYLMLCDFLVYLRELLTPQQHYDWGLRALKTVLRGSGGLLRQLKTSGIKQNGRIRYSDTILFFKKKSLEHLDL